MASTPDYRSEPWLSRQREQGHTIGEIAEKCGVAESTIYRWLDKYDIPTDKSGDPSKKDEPYRDESWLREQYVAKGRLGREIAEECGIERSTLYYWLEKFGIEVDRGVGYRPDEPEKYRDADWLQQKYHDEEMSTSEIAELCDTTKETIRRWMGRHDIDLRPVEEAIALSWDGDEERRELLRELRSKEGVDTQFYHTSEWRQTRQAVLERDGYICQNCGRWALNAHAHHETPVSEGGAKFDMDNIVTLCRECHAAEHPNRPLLQHV